MKNTILFIALFTVARVFGQTAFEANFEDDSIGLDLTTQGYELTYDPNYTGTVTLTVAESDSNKIARMEAQPSGGAKMQFVKTIDVEPGKTYVYEIVTRGPWKRQLRIYSLGDELLNSSIDYKPATEQEKTEWKKLELAFIPDPGVNQVKIGFHHYWSGTIDLDSIKVYETKKQTAYYLNSSSGNDDNPGTEDAPWKSLEKISSTTLLPGDTVLFKRGDQFNGHFVVNGSGNEEKPVLITAYGEGEKPILRGQVDSVGGGDYQEAILVENNDNLVFDGLEVQNERLASREGVNNTDAYGMYVKNSGTRVMRNIVIRNMVFRNVFAVQPILDPADFNLIQVAALTFNSSKNTESGKEKHIRDILVEDCYFENNQRFGITFKHSGGNAGIGNDSINRNMNIICLNNEFHYNGGTSILPNATYNCLIENNIFDHPGASTDPRMPGRGSSVWNINAVNTIVQYNMCLSTRGYLDSYGIHIDTRNMNTFVQYNYMDDCEGGFAEILHSNKNAVYRFNVSVNSGWRKNPTWKDSNLTIWVTSDRWSDDGLKFVDGCYIYNNTVVINKPFTTAINLDGKNMFVYNNIFSSTDGSGMGQQNTIVRNNDTPFFMSNNLFEGTVDQRWVDMDAKPQIGSPLFDSTGADIDNYSLKAGSHAIDNGAAVPGPAVEGAGYGVFDNIPAYPDVDFYGNPIDLTSGTPNIGACNVKYTAEIDSNLISDTTFVGDTIIIIDTAITCKTFHKSNDPEYLETICDTTISIDTLNLADTTSSSVYSMPKTQYYWLIYPDLAESSIKIFSKTTISGEVYVSLADLSGRIIQTAKREMYPGENGFDFKLKSFPANGIYILNIRNNGTSHSRRIVLYR